MPIKESYKQSTKKKTFPKPQGKTVYIGNLRYDLAEKDIFGIFGKFGRVKYVKLVKVPGSDKSKGIAFVNMLKSTDADKAIKTLDGHTIGGRKVKVSAANDQVKPEGKDKVQTEKKKGFNKDEIIFKKKMRRSRGLAELKAIKK